MPNNIYQLRSGEAQEVMNRAPRKLIVWGNTIIMVILIGAGLIIDLVKVPVQLKADFFCTSSVAGKKKVSLVLQTSFSPAIRGETRKWHEAQLSRRFESGNSNAHLPFFIDSVREARGNVYIFGYTISHQIIRNSAGTISVKLGERVLLDRLFNQKN